MSRIIIVGAGINGATAAAELARRGHQVMLMDPGPLPHPLAASTDISKVVRLEYGADEEYTVLAERALAGWREWNRTFGVDLFHETGLLYLRMSEIKPATYEGDSWRVLKKRGHALQRLDRAEIKKRFPAWNARRYVDGFFDPAGGYAESGRVVMQIIKQAQSLGVELREGTGFKAFVEEQGQVRGVRTTDDVSYAADLVLMTVGAWTQHLLPELSPYLRSTGVPVFHLAPEEPALFRAPVFPTFAADVSTTGYYGFPINRDGVVKIARHSVGRELHPESPKRVVNHEEEAHLRGFLARTFPALEDAPIVFRRICLYSDTPDGHFWIDHDPQRAGLMVAAGDSGHGFKFAPVLGAIIADSVEGKSNPWLKKFRWRTTEQPGQTQEAARAVERK